MPVCLDAAPGQGGEQREGGDVAGLALVGAHAKRRIALHVLHRAIALARGERDVGGGHVIVQIDKGAPGPLARKYRRERRRRGFDAVVERGQRGHLAPGPQGAPQGAEAAQRRGAGPGLGALGEAGPEREAAARRADALHARIAGRVAGPVGRIGHHGGDPLVEAQPAPPLRDH